jgi:hypothetical protein
MNKKYKNMQNFSTHKTAGPSSIKPPAKLNKVSTTKIPGPKPKDQNSK